ncbi:8401_t:CDS:1, partial [Cetraspora pellucida]
MIKQQTCKDLSRCNSNNLCDNTNKNDIKNESDKVVPLQQQLISQITDSKVVKIHGTPSKKRMKSFVEVLDRRVNNQIINNSETSSRAQRKCLLCEASGHYQKKCSNYKNKNKENVGN